MKSSLASLMILSFIGAAAFGFFGMNHVAGATHIGCIAATAKGACPEGVGDVGMALFHSDILKGFSSAVLGVNLIPALFGLVFFTVFAGLAALLAANQIFNGIIVYWHALYLMPEFYGKRRINRWLALHENSPFYFSSRER